MSNLAVTVREWETLRPDAESPLASRELNAADRALADQLRKAGCLEVLELARGLELRATSFVGRLRLGGITITVQPKLQGAPFLNLLRYAYGLRHLNLFNPAAYESEECTFQDLIIYQLISETRELMARGIHREYERVESDLSSPRGRIQFNRLAALRYRTKAALSCVYHPRVEDTILNQLLLSGLSYAASSNNNTDLGAQLDRLTKALETSVSRKRLSPTLLVNARHAVDRRTTSYQSAITLIGLLFEGEGVSFKGTRGRFVLPGFLFDMNRFFQALVSRFLHDHLENCEIEDESRLRGLFSYDSNRNPQKRRAPVPRPDFVIRAGHKIQAILDAKYRDLWEKPLPREMLYQLALYALGRREGERKAVILYPTLAIDASEQVVQLHEPVSGALQAEIVLRPVNLLELEELLRATDPGSNQRKWALAHRLSFGTAMN